MAKFEKQVSEFVGFQVVAGIAKFFYFAGLTALIPLVPLLFSPQELVEAKFAFGIALGSILLGFICIYLFSGKRYIAYRTLGLFTLIPGLLAIIFGFLGPRRVAELYRTIEVPFVDPLIEKWLQQSVPNAWLLAGIYIIVGVGFIWLSLKVKK